MPQITIYTKMLCGYCHRAKKLLASKGAAYDEIEISFDRTGRKEMIERSGGRTTVPQIFIDGRHIGGSDDLRALDETGKLDELLGVQETGA